MAYVPLPFSQMMVGRKPINMYTSLTDEYLWSIAPTQFLNDFALCKKKNDRFFLSNIKNVILGNK